MRGKEEKLWVGHTHIDVPPFMTHCIFLLCRETVESACHVENWLTALIKTSGFLSSQFPPPERANHLGPDSRTECSSCCALQSLQTTRQTLNRTGSSHQRKLSFPLAQPPPCWTLVLCELPASLRRPSSPALASCFPCYVKGSIISVSNLNYFQRIVSILTF